MKQKIINFSKQITKEDKMILAITFLVGFLNLFYLLTHNVLSPDGLAYGPIYKSNGWEVDLGRPLLLVIDRLRGGLVTPPIIVFVALFNISISIMLLKRIYQIEKKLPIILLTILIVVFPTISESALFIYCLDSYSFAFLFSILSIYFIKEKKPLLSILFTIASLSLYQAYISITITGVFLLGIKSLLENKFELKTFIKNLFYIFLGLLSYFILLKGGMLIFGRELASYKGANSFGLETITSLPNSILHAYQDYRSFFFQENIIFNQYYLRHIINYIIILLLLITWIKPFQKMNWNNRLFFILLLLLFPIATNIMNLIACDTTINLVTGIGFVMTYVLAIISYENYSSQEFLKYLGFTFLMILSYTFILSNNGTFMSRNDTYLNYYYESMNLLTKAKSLEDYQEDYQWMFSDIIRYQPYLIRASNGYLSKDYETYDNYYGIEEAEIFFDHYFGIRIKVVDYDTYQRISKTKEYQAMKIGEVKIIQNVVVCKMTEQLAY